RAKNGPHAGAEAHGGGQSQVDAGRARRLADQLAKVDALRDRIANMARELDRLGGAEGGGRSGARGAAGEAGRAGRGRSGQDAGGQSGSADLARLREQYVGQLREAAELLDQLRRENASLDPSVGHGGALGFTFEGQGMTLSAPGTEA